MRHDFLQNDRTLYIPGPAETLKVVQLHLDSEPYFACGKLFHGELLQRFLEHYHIPYSMKELGDGSIAPRPQGERYKSDGMGTLAFEGDFDVILSSRSKGYDLVPSMEHIQSSQDYYLTVNFHIRTH